MASIFGRIGVETPPFSLVQKHEGFEVRCVSWWIDAVRRKHACVPLAGQLGVCGECMCAERFNCAPARALVVMLLQQNCCMALHSERHHFFAHQPGILTNPFRLYAKQIRAEVEVEHQGPMMRNLNSPFRMLAGERQGGKGLQTWARGRWDGAWDSG